MLTAIRAPWLSCMSSVSVGRTGTESALPVPIVGIEAQVFLPEVVPHGQLLPLRGLVHLELRGEVEGGIGKEYRDLLLPLAVEATESPTGGFPFLRDPAI